MSNILVNALKSKTGGGKVLFENFLNNTHQSVKNHYYFLTPDYYKYKNYDTSNVTIIREASLYNYNFMFMVFYYIYLQMIVKKYRIDLIFNFGDVIIPCKTKQIYFFDWAYAVYSEKYIWSKMSINDFLIRRLKVLLIDKYIRNVALVLAQTKNMKRRLKSKFKINKIVVTPSPICYNQINSNDFHDFHLPENRIKFLVPANFASHKNFSIFISLAKLVTTNNIPYIFVLTLDPNSARNFFDEITFKKFDCFFNVGKQPIEFMPALYKQCDAILLPTLLESYGMPYIEAMYFQKNIFTSDLDFAHEICGNCAYYFDPFDANSILKTIQTAFWDPDHMKKKLDCGIEMINKIPSWEQTFELFENCIDLTLNC